MIGNSNTDTGKSGKSDIHDRLCATTASAARAGDERPIDPYIIKKRRSSAFQRGIAHGQQTSFTVTVTPRIRQMGGQTVLLLLYVYSTSTENQYMTRTVL